MARSTRATLALTAVGAEFSLHDYDYDSRAPSIGLQAAEALGVSPSRVLKTLMITVDGTPVCVIVPSDREVSLKRLAAVMDGKGAAMMLPIDAARMSGYVIGGISPFGQKRAVPVVVEQSALSHAAVYINGGRRGLQILIDPRDIVRILSAKTYSIIAQ